MIWSSLPWWDMLHAWWSEHPKYAFQMVTNSTSGVDQMVSDFEQATSAPPISDTQALDENMPKMTGPAQLPSIQESCNLSLSSPLESLIPSLPFIGAQHSLIDSYPQADLALNSLLIMDPSLPLMNSTLPSFDPPLPPTSSIDSSPFTQMCHSLTLRLSQTWMICWPSHFLLVHQQGQPLAQSPLANPWLSSLHTLL